MAISPDRTVETSEIQVINPRVRADGTPCTTVNLTLYNTSDLVSINNLIAPLQPPVLGGRAGLEDGLDVDGHVAVGAAEAADDGEAEAVLAPLQLDHLRGLLIHLI